MAFESGTTLYRNVVGGRVRRLTHIAAGLGVLLVAGVSQPASALNFNFFGIEGDWSLTGRYAYQVRAEEKSKGVILTEGRYQIPIPDYFKWPNSFNFDDGDRSYEQWDPIYNRVILSTSLGLEITDHFGLSFSADAFYDHVYQTKSGYEGPTSVAVKDSLNSVGHPPNEFTDVAKDIMGEDIRLKNAYAYGTFFFGGTSLDVKVGQMVAAWGQSTFFSGIARAMSAADATRATVPGTSPSSIFIPVMQLTARWRLNRKITLVFNQKFEWQPNHLNPIGTYYSVSDVIAPGGDFAWAIKNPLNPKYLKHLKLNGQSGKLLDNVLTSALGVPTGDLLQGLLSACNQTGFLCDTVQQVGTSLVGNLLNLLDTAQILSYPRGFPVARVDDVRPDHYNTGQWGIGLEYNLSWTTEIGFYHLNYHSHIPLPSQNFSPGAVVARGPAGNPVVTTGTLGLTVPTTYNLVYFQDIKMDALTFSTVLFGYSVAGEFIYRRGAPTLAKDPGNALSGAVPSPARSENAQVLINAVKTFGPTDWWDSLIFVGAVSYIRLLDIEPQKTQADLDNDGTIGEQSFDELIDLFDKQAAAFASRIMISYDSVFPGWDLTIPVNLWASLWNRTPMPGAFASLFSQGDYRVGIGATFSHLGALDIGVNYMAYLGDPDDDHRPLQDRDTLGFYVKYSFF